MALIVCSECGKNISDKATACPHCGTPPAVKSTAAIKPQWSLFTRGMIALFFVVLLGILTISERTTKEAPRRAVSLDSTRIEQIEQTRRKEMECRKSLECWGEKKSLLATMQCQDKIEKLAKHQAEWTDGWLGSKFTHYKWRDQTNGIITYVGDRIKFQNGFGAWTPIVYECDFDTRDDNALAVRAQEGRLQ